MKPFFPLVPDSVVARKGETCVWTNETETEVTTVKIRRGDRQFSRKGGKPKLAEGRIRIEGGEIGRAKSGKKRAPAQPESRAIALRILGQRNFLSGWALQVPQSRYVVLSLLFRTKPE